MTRVSVEEIQQDVSAFLQRVEAGETLLIMRTGKPIAEIKPVVVPPEALRPFGLCAGEFTVPEDFDVPLPEDIINAFEDA
jgi:antitoxin (DNA-binding transcriptional repressor) of toxin-antitoxin stability system